MKKIIYILSIFTISLLLSSCESETSILNISEELGFTGTTEDIQDFLGQDVYEAMLDRGLIIHPGSTPTNLQGTFRAEPYCRVDEDGELSCFQNSSWNVTFSNQNNDTLSISYFAQQIDSTTGEIIGSESGTGRISGDITGAFTVIVNATTDNGIKTATAYSGTLNSLGIAEYQDIYVNDTDSSVLTPVLYIDGDGTAERVN